MTQGAQPHQRKKNRKHMGFLPNSSWSWWFGLNVARCGQDYINIDLKNIFKCRLVCAEDYGGLGLNSVIK